MHKIAQDFGSYTRRIRRCILVDIRPTIYAFLDREYAKTIGIRVALWELMCFFALGMMVSAVSKVAGAILIFCFLVVTPSAGLLLAKRMRWVMLIAILGGFSQPFRACIGLFVGTSPPIKPFRSSRAFVLPVLWPSVLVANWQERLIFARNRRCEIS